MPTRRLGVLAIFAAICVPLGMIAAPIANADECDPTATVCQGSEVQTGGPAPASAPSTSMTDEQYPYDSQWYFDPAGGGTFLQPDHTSGEPSHASGHGGGGGHR